MRGLVRNRTNPFIVYSILFDYIVIKMNFVVWAGNLISLVKQFYKGLKLHSNKGKPFILRVN